MPALAGAPEADALFDYVVSCHTSPLVLFLYKLSPHTLQSTTLGKVLVNLAVSRRIPGFSHAFFKRVRQLASGLEVRGDAFYVCDYKKDAALQKFRDLAEKKKKKAPPELKDAYFGALMPYLMQYRPSKDEKGSLFFVYSTYELGFRTSVRILREGFSCPSLASRHFNFIQCYEIRLQDSFGYAVVDWEVMEGSLKSQDGSLRMAREDIDLGMRSFPLMFAREAFPFLSERRMLTALRNQHTKNAVATKEKSRVVPFKGPGDGQDDYKHSMHFVFDICDVPGKGLKHLFDRVLRPRTATLKKDLSNFESEQQLLDASWWLGVDQQPCGGHTPIATVFSRKLPGDPCCCLAGRAYFKYDEGDPDKAQLYTFPRDSGLVNPVPFRPPPSQAGPGQPRQHRLEDLTDDQAAQAFWYSSCAAPREEVVELSRAFRDSAEVQQIRTAARHHGTSGGGPPLAGGGPGGGAGGAARDSIDLPAWFKGYLFPGNVQRQHLAQKYRGYLQQLALPGDSPVEAWNGTQVERGFYCPYRLSDPKKPDPQRHNTNNVLVFSDGKHVVSRCLDGTCMCTVRGTNQWVRRVLTKSGEPTYYYEITEEGMDAIFSVEGKKKQQQELGRELSLKRQKTSGNQ